MTAKRWCSRPPAIGIPVATARVELHSKGKDPGPWTAEAWVETNKFAERPV